MSGKPSLSRRGFLATGAALSALAVAGCSSNDSFKEAEPKSGAEAAGEEKIVWGHCANACPSYCALKLHVRDDEIVEVGAYARDTDDLDDIQPRCCLRGHSYRRLVNSPDRINYPLKRVGKRGEGKFEQISWDEALELIATNYQEVVDKYGHESVFLSFGTGAYGVTARPWFRLLNTLGGYLSYYGNYSNGQMLWIAPYIYGAGVTVGSTIKAARDADLVLMFGGAPTETRAGGAASHHDYVAMRETTKGTIYVIDPRMNDALIGHSDQWIPINPGTDGALVAALAHELMANDQVDLDFLHTYCVGYDEETMPESAKGQNKSYVDYVMGTGYDQVEKTPEWAAPITGISADRIRELAQEIGTAKVLHVNQSWGPNRRSNGEMQVWSICMLPILTGQIGLPGTSNGLREANYTIAVPNMPTGDNPVKTQVSVFSMVDAIDRGDQMTEKADGVVGKEKLEVPVKFAVVFASNLITNQNSDINWVHDVMADESKCQFVLGCEIQMTDSMKYCDVILPDMYRFEQECMLGGGGDDAYVVFGQSPYENEKFERKTGYDACALIADKLGAKDAFTDGGKTQADWIKEAYEQAREKDDTLPAYDELKEQGVHTKKCPTGSVIALEAFRTDPVANPLKTPSGKIEIYSEQLDAYIQSHEFQDDDHVTPIATYVPEWYGVETVTEEYPLVLTGFHSRARVGSSWGNVDAIKELNPQEAWVNPVDAQERGLKSGDKARIKNDFGEIEIAVRVTSRIVPGVVGVPTGAWHDADMVGDRVDKGGCMNTLTTHRPTPFGKCDPQHTNICQMTKASA
ncbi:DMSO/selenate family reductase complex A subunit [Eggerthella sinensis]|uniref:DMSO/selenate family reductase complex A subunit n=1 Tax=Eggerthella sinensis TaxID=242230 RepID=UPI00248E8DF2|nr:DMSO/selenate family reductase complex A subunit [Eggerthella sinensis]